MQDENILQPLQRDTGMNIYAGPSGCCPKACCLYNTKKNVENQGKADYSIGLRNRTKFEGLAVIVRIYEENPQLRLIRKAVDILKSGGIIVYPTDTIYGLGCDLHNKKALEKIYRIKKMDQKTPLSFVSFGLDNVSTYAHVSNSAYRLMNKCLPGPFTFILPATKEVNRYMIYKRKQIGIRVPASNVCRLLTEELLNPVISTSVPLWGDEVLNSGEIIHDYFDGQVDLVLDIGVLVSEPSTIIDCSDDAFHVIRQGKGKIQL